MRISIRGRITMAMALVVTANLVTATVSAVYFARAAQYQARMVDAASRARVTAEAATRLTEFMTEAESYALALDTRRPEDESDAYGRLARADAAARSSIAMLSSTLPLAAGGEADASWKAVREGAFTWLGAEAVAIGAGFRPWISDDGSLNTNSVSNVPAPAYMRGMSAVEMRRALGSQADGLRDGIVRRAAEEADAAAGRASADASRARLLARDITIGLALASLLAAVAAGGWLHSGIVGPLDEARGFADRVAGGHLDTAYGTHRHDEIGHLTTAIENMRDTVVRDLRAMHEMAGAVLITAEEVASAARGALETAQTDACGAGTILEELTEVVSQAESLSGLAAQMQDV